MKKWLLILMTVVAFGCGDGGRDNGGSTEEETGTTSSEGRDEAEVNDEGDMKTEKDQAPAQDTKGHLRVDSTETRSPESGAKENTDSQDDSEKDY